MLVKLKMICVVLVAGTGHLDEWMVAGTSKCLVIMRIVFESNQFVRNVGVVAWLVVGRSTLRGRNVGSEIPSRELEGTPFWRMLLINAVWY